MIEIQVKPLTVNRSWQGRRFKTKLYESYEKELMYLLPNRIDIPEGKLKLKVVYGMSNKMSDVDNPTKPFIDILQKKYGFNDNRIYKLELEKVDVRKGKEFIKFKF